MKFYLGTHKAHWLTLPRFTNVPLFISHRTLAVRAKLPRALGPWSLDSGGFTELSMHGKWKTTRAEYIDATYRYRDEVGGLEWASQQDWMCEDVMLERTGKTVDQHQGLSLENLIGLREEAPDLPYIPVLQGYKPADYVRHFHMYADAGIDLRDEPIVGVGSVCRRQATAEIGALVRELAQEGLRMHGFGVKVSGVRQYGEHLTSSDSLAWSYNARRNPPIAGHPHAACNNCPEWALRWRDNLLRVQPQPTLF